MELFRVSLNDTYFTEYSMNLFTDEAVSKIIPLLSRKPGLTALQILSSLKDSGFEISLSGLYKELEKLISAGIAFKVGKEFRLHLNWVLEILNLTAVLQQNYFDNSTFLQELPHDGTTVRWKVNNLYRANDLFTNVVLQLIRRSTQKLHLSWNAHPWFHLIQNEAEQVFFRALKMHRVRMYKIIGNDTRLDKWSEQFWDPEMVVWSYAESPFHSHPDTYLTVVDDYVVKLQISSKIVRKLDTLYNSVSPVPKIKTNKRGDNDLSYYGLDPRLLTLLFDERTNCSISIQRSTKKSQKIRAQYVEYFGRLLGGDERLHDK
jgi:hypothetical protein